MLEKTERLESSLIDFVRDGWRYIDPVPFVDNWHLEAIAEHLQAVTDGDIRRLLINVPPRTSKSSLVSVAWPAWTWAQSDISPSSGPQVQFLFASYAQSLSLRDSVKTRRLLESPWYQEKWGRRFTLTGDQNTKIRYDNDKGGYRLATSVGGALTGEGGQIICFPADELVETERGRIRIGDIVHDRQRIKVWSLNTKTGNMELKPVVGWWRNPASRLVKVTLSDGSVMRCTPNHLVWTRGGWKRAAELGGHDLLPAPRWMHVAPAAQVHDRQSEVRPYMTSADAANGRSADAVFGSQNGCNIVMATVNFAHHCFGKMSHAVSKSPVTFAVVDVLKSCTVLKVIQSWIGSIAVDMTDLLPLWAWPYEGFGNHAMGEAVKGLAVSAQGHARVSLVQDGRHDLRRQHEGAVVSHASNASHGSEGGYFVAWEADDRFPLLVENDVHADETFCLTVADNHTFCVGHGNIIVKNCVDDPHNALEVESDAIREATLQWWDESLSTRLNDPITGAYVIIMQRLYETDLTGHILSRNEGDWTHLMLPMRYEPQRACKTSLGFEDPRTEEGELLWPVRFPEAEVVSLERRLGSFAASGQLQQSPVPRGGGIFKRDWWQLYPPEGEAFNQKTGKPVNLLQFPTMDYIVASVDTAYTEKEENDYSACTVLGSWRNEHDLPKVMLMDAWQERLQFRDLVERIIRTCVDLKVDRLLIEAKASGISVAQEIGRLMRGEAFSVNLVDPKGDKVARAYSVTNLFEAGIVYAPDRKWADTVIDQCASFPKAAHDDLVDALVGGLKHLRDSGVALLREERDDDLRQRMTFRKQAALPYAV